MSDATGHRLSQYVECCQKQSFDIPIIHVVFSSGKVITYFRRSVNAASLGSKRSARRDLNEQTNQRPRQSEAAGFPSLLPNHRAAPLFALLFEMSSKSRRTPTWDNYEVA